MIPWKTNNGTAKDVYRCGNHRIERGVDDIWVIGKSLAKLGFLFSLRRHKTINIRAIDPLNGGSSVPFIDRVDRSSRPNFDEHFSWPEIRNSALRLSVGFQCNAYKEQD